MNRKWIPYKMGKIPMRQTRRNCFRMKVSIWEMTKPINYKRKKIKIKTVSEWVGRERMEWMKMGQLKADRTVNQSINRSINCNHPPHLRTKWSNIFCSFFQCYSFCFSVTLVKRILCEWICLWWVVVQVLSFSHFLLEKNLKLISKLILKMHWFVSNFSVLLSPKSEVLWIYTWTISPTMILLQNNSHVSMDLAR